MHINSATSALLQQINAKNKKPKSQTKKHQPLRDEHENAKDTNVALLASLTIILIKHHYDDSI